jgi:hypothetical protein
MTPPDFLKSVYLGDRGCKRLLIDGWNRRFAMQVNCISRIPKGETYWNFYTDEDIDDGWLVFEGVASLSIEPVGAIPDDFIGDITVIPSGDNYSFAIPVGATNLEGQGCQSTIEFVASSVSLFTPGDLVRLIADDEPR